MKLVHLIQWQTDEAKERAAKLEAAGYEVQVTSDTGKNILPKLRQKMPDAVVIDLSRLPSHGRAVGVVLRKQKRTRSLPLLFVDGQPEKVARVKSDLPDAVYISDEGLESALAEAIRPVLMAG